MPAPRPTSLDPFARCEAALRAAAGTCFLATLATSCDDAPHAPRPGIALEVTVRDLLAEPPEWRVVSARVDAPLAMQVISPALGGRIDGADMHALVMPPPCEVRFSVDERDLPARLCGRVGVDCTVLPHLSSRFPEATVVFEVLAEGRVLTRAEVLLERAKRNANAWVDLGGADGVELRAPLELTLRTSVLDAAGAPLDPPLAVRAGFGGLRLARRSERERTRSSIDEPNVVLVLMDTLRADRLSAYGYPRATSPTLDALARRGVLHEQAYATSSWTWPSTASVLTGLPPEQHGVLDEGSSYLAEGVRTLAEIFQEHGFTTAAWSANPIVSAARNFDQGFERFDSPARDFRKTGEFFEEVRAWLRERGDERFFLYLHLAEPHAPLAAGEEGARRFAPDVPSAAWRVVEERRHALLCGAPSAPEGGHAYEGLISREERAWANALYDANVWCGDRWLGELLAELDALGLGERTLVAFTADHGEELFERGFFGHGHGLHGEQVRVPLVLAGPGVPAGRVAQPIVSNRLLTPALLQLAGIEHPDGAPAADALIGEKSGGDPVVFSTAKARIGERTGVYLLGLRNERWFLQLVLGSDAAGNLVAGESQLFDVIADPEARVDVSAERAALTAELAQTLLESVQQLRDARVGQAVRAGVATRRLLSQLGYSE